MSTAMASKTKKLTTTRRASAACLSMNSEIVSNYLPPRGNKRSPFAAILDTHPAQPMEVRRRMPRSASSLVGQLARQ